MTITAVITLRQLEKIGDYAPPELLPVFHHDVVESGTGKYTVKVTAPFVAWEILVAEIHRRVTTRGERVDGDHGRYLRGITARISKPMNAVMMHPALAGRAKAGEHLRDGAFPVWSMPEDRWGRIWWPSPRDGEFELLKPNLSTVKGMRITSWSHLGIVPPHWCHDPALHVAIAQRGTLPALSAAAPPGPDPSPD